MFRGKCNCFLVIQADLMPCEILTGRNQLKINFEQISLDIWVKYLCLRLPECQVMTRAGLLSMSRGLNRGMRGQVVWKIFVGELIKYLKFSFQIYLMLVFPSSRFVVM